MSKPGVSLARTSSIVSNLDRTLSLSQIKEGERSERRKEFIDRKYKAAEVAERTGVGDTPDTIFSGLQRNEVFTADPTFDKSREAVVGRRQLPVKQFEVTEDGDWQVTLGEAATEVVRDRRFCIECLDPQPEDPVEWKRAAKRLERLIGPPPTDGSFRHGERCCYCGVRLGLGDEFKEKTVQLWQFTPEQRHIFETMFGQKIAPERE